MTQCPNCSSVMPDGEMICPACGHEIRLVPDYETLSTTLLKKEKEESEQNEQDIRDAMLLEQEEKYYHRNRVRTNIIVLVLIAACAVTAIALYTYWKNNANVSTEMTADDYYDQAFLAYNNHELEHANGLLAEALVLDPAHQDAMILKAKVINELGNKYEAITQLRDVITANPEAIEAYRYLITIYQADNDSDSINELLDGSPESIRTALKDYISGAPIFSLEPGTYNTEQDIEITATGVRIYYTTDGSVPTKESTVYSGPVHISIGTTYLKAVSETSTGVLSSVSEAEYYVDLNAPEAPVLDQPSGTYYGEEGKITITFPADCRCYYAFDSRPTKFSRRYITPVQMPEGDHIFYAIVVNSDGISGPIAAATYIYSPEDPYAVEEEQYYGQDDWSSPVVPAAPVTSAPTQAPSPTDKPEPTKAPDPTVTTEPTKAPDPTDVPTKEPTPEPTVEPTEEPTPEPTAEPTEEPTPEPTAEPTAEPTPEPTAEPTPEPTPEPTTAPDSTNP